MRLLISGYYGFDNLGDEAILAALLQELAKRHPDWTPIVLSGKPSATEARYGVPAVSRDSLLGLWWEMGRADLLLSGGGGLLQNATSQLSLMYYLGIMELARRRGVPYILLGQGLGPLRGPGVLKIVSRFLRRAEAIVVRESDSRRLVEAMGVTEVPVRQAADLALLLEPAGEGVARSLREGLGLAEKEPVLGLILRNWNGHEPWGAAVELCDYLQQSRGLRSVLLPFQSEDLPLAWRIASACQTDPVVLEAPVSPAEMLSLIGTLEMVVSMRLHGLIFAAQQQVPALGLAYDPKVFSFAVEAGQRALPLAEVTGKVLCAAVEELGEAHAEQAPERAEAVKYLRRAAQVNFTVLDEVAEKISASEAVTKAGE